MACSDTGVGADTAVPNLDPNRATNPLPKIGGKRSGSHFREMVQGLPGCVESVEGWTVLPFARWLLNSAFVSFVAIWGPVFSSAVVGFGFGRIRFPGRNALFLLVLSTMILPFPSVIVPLFPLFKELGWIDV